MRAAARREEEALDFLTHVSADEEIAHLREQVAWLESERDALWWAVTHDDLTGLANRRLFNSLAPPLLSERGRRSIVIVLDLNGFKPINDQFGHAAGDEVLRIVAERMTSCSFNLAARLGGDEFAAVLSEPYFDDDPNWWLARVRQLAMSVAEPMQIGHRALCVTASIGIAPAGDDLPMHELLHRADQAMYQAKVNNRPHITWERHFEPQVPTRHRVVELAVYPAPAAQPATRSGSGSAPGSSSGRPSQAPVSPAPIMAPERVQPAKSYRRGDPVWVLRYGAWRPGVVESASVLAIMATFRCNDGAGTVVDTMSAEYVQPREASSAELNSIASHPITAA
jgi:diguanylate cyclase (GGDEF)-like protein